MSNRAQIESGNGTTREVTLRELVDALAHLRDEDTFRWFQTSSVGVDGQTQPGPTLRVTMGQARVELSEDPRGTSSPSESPAREPHITRNAATASRIPRRA